MGNTRGLTDKPITREVVVDPKTGKTVAAHLSDVVTDPTSADAVQVPDADQYPTANATKLNPLAVQSQPSPADALDPDEGTGTNEVQTIANSGTVSGGTFKVTFRGDQTAAIAYNATAATLQTELLKLNSIGKNGEGANNVAVAGGPLPGATTVTFQNDLGAEDQPALVIDNSAITGGGTLAVTETTKGVHADAP